MGAWSRGNVPKELIELSLQFYAAKGEPLPIESLQEKNRKKQAAEVSKRFYAANDKPLPVEALREIERKRTAREELKEIDLRRQELLKEYPELEPSNRISVKTIIEETAKYYGFPPALIISAQRQATLVFARQIAYYLSRETPCGPFRVAPSLPDIGRRFGGRDHTTIISGIRRIQAMLDSGNTKVAVDVDILRSLIRARDTSVCISGEARQAGCAGS